MLKKIILSICILLMGTVGLIAQQEDPFADYKAYLDQMDYSNIESGFLLNRGFMSPFYQSSLGFFNTFVDQDTGDKISTTLLMNQVYWDVLYLGLLESDVRTGVNFKSIDEIDQIIESYNDNEVPFLIFDVEASLITQELIDDYVTNQIPTIAQDDTNTFNYNIFGAVTHQNISHSREVNFSIRKELFFSNRSQEPTALYIDFGDGNGANQYTFEDQIITVNYPTRGGKSIQVVVEYDNGNHKLTNSFAFEINRNSEKKPPFPDKPIKLIPFDGGTAYAYLSGEHFDRPIIVQHGFDLTDDINITTREEKYGEYFNSTFKPKGYDLVLIVLDDPNRSLASNTQSLKDAIIEINDEKESKVESILIGESMGGLLCRAALKELENEGINHQVGLYMSFDAPHKGANIPIGFQNFVNDLLNLYIIKHQFPLLVDYIDSWVININENFNTRLSNVTLHNEENRINAIRSALHSDAAKDMLIRHMDYDGTSRFEANYNYLGQLGYPEESRNITLINGSHIAEPRLKFDGTPLQLSDHLIDKTIGTEHNYIHVDVPVSPVNTTSVVSTIKGFVGLPDVRPVWVETGRNICDHVPAYCIGASLLLGPLSLNACMTIECFPELKVEYEEVFNPGSTIKIIDKSDRTFIFDDVPYDIAPGAHVDMEGIDPSSILNSYFCFIPTVSALDINQSYLDTLSDGGVYAVTSEEDIDDFVENGTTPFDEVYSLGKNTSHVSYEDEEIDGLFLDIVDDEFDNLSSDIQNRTITNSKSFITNDEIKVGRDINEVTGKHMENGPVVVESGVSAHFESEKSVLVKDGTLFKSGSMVCLKIDPENPVFNRPPSPAPNYYAYSIVNGDKSICFESIPSFSIETIDTNVGGVIDYVWVLDDTVTYQGNSIDITEELYVGMHSLTIKTFYQGTLIEEFTKVFEVKLGFDCDYGSGTSNRNAKAVEKSELENISIGPNPFNDFIEIELPNEVFEKTSAMKLELFDSLGRLVKNLSIVDLEAKNVNINIGTTISPGAYFLRITTSSGRIIVKKLMHE